MEVIQKQTVLQLLQVRQVVVLKRAHGAIVKVSL
jgi:hypothetical protein